MEAALWYSKKGWPVIPINPAIDPVTKKGKKKPLLPTWEEFQKRVPTEKEITEWWQKWPTAMVGVITGEFSNVFAIDCDTEEAYQKIQEYLPESLVLPIAQTPRGGKHLWFSYPKKSNLTVAASVLPGTDYRGNGGYIISPPSQNGANRSYQWLIEPQKELPEIPESLLALINKNTIYSNVGKIPPVYNGLQPSTNVYNMFQEGTRDQDLFHIANQLKRAGSSVEEISQVLEILAKNCNPPFPEKELEEKIKSALKRAEKRERPIVEEIKEFLGLQPSTFSLQNVYNGLHLSTREDKKTAWIALRRMEGTIVERVGSLHGTYKVIDKTLKRIDLKDKSDLLGELPIKFPLGIHEFIKVMPKCIYIVAGEPDSGKSAYLMNFAKKNCEKYPIHYFSSEMGKAEFLDRLQYLWPEAENEFNLNFYERSENFDEVIFPNDINIIDYMTLYDNFFLMAGLINAIGKKLKDGIAFIALQKPPGRDTALGGDRTKDLARLYLALSYQQMKIVKAKNWREPKFNPNRLTISYEIWQGCHFKNTTSWKKEGQKNEWQNKSDNDERRNEPFT